MQLPLVNGKLHIDNSLLELLACPRKLEYNQIQKRIPAIAGQALSFGTAIHLALECRYKNFEPLWDVRACETAQAQLLEQHFSANPPPEGDHRDFNFALEVVQHYNATYGIEPFNLLEYDTPVPCNQCGGDGEINAPSVIKCPMCQGTGKATKMCELPFALDLCTLNGLEVVYTGKIDLPVSWDGHIMIGDNKTASQLGPSYFDQYRMSSQLIGYCYAFKETTGKKPIGFFVNAIRTKAKSLKMTTGASTKTDEAKWWSECFFREKEYVDQWRLDEWKQNAIAKVEELLWHYSRGYFPMKTTACVMWGRCAFYDICYYPPNNRADILAGNSFKDNTWTPLTKK